MRIMYEKMPRCLNAASQSGVKSNVRSQNVGVLKAQVFFLLVNRVGVQTSQLSISQYQCWWRKAHDGNATLSVWQAMSGKWE